MRSRPVRGIDARLLAASKSGDLPQVRNLLKRGANVKTRSPKNETPLHCAARSGQITLVRYFIGLGADLNARTLRGASVLRFATQSKNRRLVRWLFEEQQARFADADDLNAAFFGALGKSDYLMARLLAKYGADVRALGWRSQTALHVAARLGDFRTVVWLVQKENFPLDAKDEFGQTPFDLATEKIRAYLENRPPGDISSQDASE